LDKPEYVLGSRNAAFFHSLRLRMMVLPEVRDAKIPRRDLVTFSGATVRILSGFCPVETIGSRSVGWKSSRLAEIGRSVLSTRRLRAALMYAD